MVIVDADHPDIEEFVEWKAHEEKKAKILLDAGVGLDSQGRPDFNGEAYQTVSGQNSNNSVRVTDAFIHAVQQDKDWNLVGRVGNKVRKTVKARDLWNKIAKAAWECADPGLQYDDTIQKWHTCKNTDRIYATNPCSEFVFLDETSCNLASVNLMKFYDDALGFDIEAYRHACRVMFMAQEIGVDLFSYPSKTIAEMTHKTRPLGLGYANLGTLLMCMGMPYNGPEGRAIAGAITALMHGQAFLTSAEMAKVKGPFKLYEENRKPFLEVMSMHREAAYKVQATGSPLPEAMPGVRPEKWFTPIADAACKVWDQVLDEGKKHGFRNAQSTVLAPTGTIGLLMDCDTTGVEPEFSLVKWKKLAGGGYFQIINQSVPRALRNLGYSDKEVADIEAHAVGKKDASGQVVEPGKETVEGAPALKKEHYAVFDCANTGGDGSRYIEPQGHLFMMAAVQPFLSGAISKTVNLPNQVTEKDIADTYELGWKLGLKAVALYRDGCKASQPLNTKKAKSVAEEKAEAKAAEAPKGPKWGELERLPRFSDNIIKREITVMDQKLGSVKVHLMFRENPRGFLKEIFLTVGKNGSSTHELCRDLGIAWSKQLRLGLPSKDLALDLLNEHGSVQGMTDHPLIKSCNSVKDLIGKLILYEYHGKTEFLNPELLESYQQSLDYVPPRHVVVEELEALRKLKETRKETPLTVFVDAKPQLESVDPNEMASKFMGDAPDCDTCGYKTVRNAACYKCLNCGNSMGCS
jgi:ribonucleoside-diphosphate reductase alpha chain